IGRSVCDAATPFDNLFHGEIIDADLPDRGRKFESIRNVKRFSIGRPGSVHNLFVKKRELFSVLPIGINDVQMIRRTNRLPEANTTTVVRPISSKQNSATGKL